MLDKMTKIAFLLMAGLAVVALTVSPVAAASRPAPSAAMPDENGLAPDEPWADAPNAVLYNQYDNSGTVALNSQDFEAAYDAYDDCLADDFAVPANVKWTIGGVGAQGLYFNGPGPAQAFRIRIYIWAGMFPGALKIERSDLGYTLNGTDQFRIKVNPKINIPGGAQGRHVWIEIEAQLAFAGGLGGQWGWTDRLVVSGEQGGAWQNPGGGFGVCPSWDKFDNCFGGLNDGDDLVFLLVGTQTP
jgi:hypothetical protein